MMMMMGTTGTEGATARKSRQAGGIRLEHSLSGNELVNAVKLGTRMGSGKEMSGRTITKVSKESEQVRIRGRFWTKERDQKRRRFGL
jgi:hypothetical protein